jgi:hypothetical protein
VTPLASAISLPWPMRPKPVMSVQACTSWKHQLRRFADSGASSNSPTAASSLRSAPRLSAVASTPVPSALVRMRHRQTRPALRTTPRIDGPHHDNPYFNLGVVTVWPPTMERPPDARRPRRRG